jgi:hypothetical protein
LIIHREQLWREVLVVFGTATVGTKRMRSSSFRTEASFLVSRPGRSRSYTHLRGVWVDFEDVVQFLLDCSLDRWVQREEYE